MKFIKNIINDNMNFDFDPKQPNLKENIFFYILISVFITLMISFFTKVALLLMNCGDMVLSSNRSDYLTIFATHCSVVFLTTSLMAILSERNQFVYWVEMVTAILIYPRFFGFLPLVIYSMSTILWAFVGFVFSFGWLIIGSFIFGLITVTVLFSRMVTIYYQRDKSKIQIEEYFIKKISENDYEKYLQRLKEVTFIKAGAREFFDVYDNLNLLEKGIKKIWEICPRPRQSILYAEGLAECVYVDLIIDLSINYPQEMQDYIESHTDAGETIKKLCYLAYPTILNSFLSNNRNDLFYRALNKWSNINDQRSIVVKYIIDKAVKGDDYTIAEYYSKLFNPFNHEITTLKNDFYCIDILIEVYWQDRQAFDNICTYNNNRVSICQHFFERSKIESINIERVLVSCSEINISNTEPDIFMQFISGLLNDEIIAYDRGSDDEKNEIEQNPEMYLIIKEIIQNRKVDDISYLCEKILNTVCDLDSIVYTNAGSKCSFYKNFEQWSLDYALLKNKKELECAHSSLECVQSTLIIDELQRMLDKLNYKDRRKS